MKANRLAPTYQPATHSGGRHSQATVAYTSRKMGMASRVARPQGAEPGRSLRLGAWRTRCVVCTRRNCTWVARLPLGPCSTAKLSA
ncbi:hypothetical protein BN948_04724 [Hydrogenophaga intermedia]|uniref:Uncharacterized protein n=1 Tax=Hydrogenophaga intermedia TaxID=65786 RepID=A0A1L1PJV4_HYDIT|nr:hypothetical protein BN948_04724 [Hydrogenophaga intermedia]